MGQVRGRPNFLSPSWWNDLEATICNWRYNYFASPLSSSGSSYLYALLDHEWKEGMSQEEAEKFVVKVVSLAMARDGASGGVVRTVTVSSLSIFYVNFHAQFP
uniref:Uncharacterized protein n=1 Tax=Zea mays TaxID=4577 RepID=C0P902_MAIZE|nr:unknown [Zea mays]